MTTDPTTSKEIARLRSDLNTIHTAMDDSLPFTHTDIKFYWAFIVVLGLSLIAQLFGLTQAVSKMILLIPISIVATGYLFYLWKKSQIDSSEKPVVKKDYRFTAIFAPILLAGLLALRNWGTHIGIPHSSFNAISVCVLGLIMIISSFAFGTSPIAQNYKRTTSRFGGLMLILLGLGLPYIGSGNPILTATVFGIVCLVPLNLWSKYLLNKQEKSATNS